MILRKPYAFFIKHFKFFNGILMLLEIYLIYKLSFIVDFLFDYPSYPQGAVGQNLIGTLLQLRIFVVTGLVAFFSIILVLILSSKKKPIKMYFFIVLFNAFILIFLFILRNYLSIIQLQVIDNRTALGLRDISLISLIVLSFIGFLLLIRTVGFDIKSFEFGQDLQELNISEEDSEEFEVKIELDTNEFKRNFNRRIRYFKYYLREHKLSVILIITFVIAFGSYMIYSKSGLYFNAVKVDNVFKANNFSIGISKYYMTDRDYKGNILTNDTTLVVVPIKIKTNGVKEKFEASRFALNINNNRFYHTTKYKSRLIDLGVTYDSTLIESEFKNYILVFEIPNSLAYKESILEYNTTDEKQIKIQMKKYDMDTVTKSKDYMIGEELVYDSDLVNGAKMVINNIELEDRFKSYYKYCISNSECYDSYEYIVPDYKSLYNKIILKISGKFDFDKINMDVKDVGEFINNYGSVIYTVADDDQKKISGLKVVYPNRVKDENNYYFEVLDSVNYAEHITLQLKIRNNVYSYVLK